MSLRHTHARQLRKCPTDAERVLWRYLRGKQVEGCKFRRQHPIKNYIVDFVCLPKKLIIELDGGQHLQQQTYDARRSKALEGAGYRVLRFWNHEVLLHCDAVCNAIHRALSET